MDNYLTERMELENNFDYVAIVDKEKLIELLDNASQHSIIQYTLTCLSNGNFFYVAVATEEGITRYGINNTTNNDDISSLGLFGINTYDFIESKEEFLKKLDLFVKDKIVIISDSVFNGEEIKDFAITSNSLLSPYKIMRSSREYKEQLGDVLITVDSHKVMKVFLILIIFLSLLYTIIFATLSKYSLMVFMIAIDIVLLVLYISAKKSTVCFAKDSITFKNIFSKKEKCLFDDLESIQVTSVKQTNSYNSYKFKTKNNHSFFVKTIFLESFQHEFMNYVIQHFKNNNTVSEEKTNQGIKYFIK